MKNTQATKIRDSKTGRLRQPMDLDKDRVRFNWGYHDGAHEWTQHRGSAAIRLERWGTGWQSKHHDPVYVAGYNCGQHDAKVGCYFGDSRLAWDKAVTDGRVNGVDGHCSNYRREQ